MHRQSLGSPASKLHIHHGLLAGVIKEDLSNSLAVSQSPNRVDQSTVAAAATDEERKSIKSPQKSVGRRLIHLIPLLTLFCFLVLYLSSHDPSQKDMAQFDGLKIFSKSTDSSDIDDLGRILETDDRGGDVLAIRSLQQEVGRQRGLHRKIGDF